MMEFIKFTFQSFWHFIGMAMLLNGLAYFVINGIIRITAIVTLRKNPQQLNEIFKETDDAKTN